MSNVGKKIERLISDGFSYNTLRGLSEGQINLLYNRLVEQVDSAKVDELTTKVTNLRNQLSAAGEDMKKLGLAEDDIDNINPYKGQQTQQPKQVGPSSNDGFDNYQDGEMTEKFESKAQQKLFWARCEDAKSPKAKKKWCKWAKEYSDKTDFSKLPEKKKQVKEIEEGLTKLVEKYIPESITKRELFRMLEQATAPAKPKEKERTKTNPGTKPGKANPFQLPKTHPKPKAGDTKVAPAKPTTKPTTKPGKANPFQLPKTHPKPKATNKTPNELSYNTFISLGYNLK
jgi:hypothetical protein